MEHLDGVLDDGELVGGHVQPVVEGVDQLRPDLFPRVSAQVPKGLEQQLVGDRRVARHAAARPPQHVVLVVRALNVVALSLSLCLSVSVSHVAASPRHRRFAASPPHRRTVADRVSRPHSTLAAKSVLVYGGAGALGRSLVSAFKARDWVRGPRGAAHVRVSCSGGPSFLPRGTALHRASAAYRGR